VFAIEWHKSILHAFVALNIFFIFQTAASANIFNTFSDMIFIMYFQNDELNKYINKT